MAGRRRSGGAGTGCVLGESFFPPEGTPDKPMLARRAEARPAPPWRRTTTRVAAPPRLVARPRPGQPLGQPGHPGDASRGFQFLFDLHQFLLNTAWLIPTIPRVPWRAVARSAPTAVAAPPGSPPEPRARRDGEGGQGRRRACCPGTAGRPVTRPVEDAAEAEQVARGVDRPPRGLLGGHVRRACRRRSPSGSSPSLAGRARARPKSRILTRLAAGLRARCSPA